MAGVRFELSNLFATDMMLITHRSSIMGQVEDLLAHILYHSIVQRKQQILGNRNSISYCAEVLHLKDSTSTR